MCNMVCHTVRENALTVNCSLIFKPKRQCIVRLFSIFSLTIKDKTKFYTYNSTVVYPIRNGHFKMADCTSF